jgi:hypothetical protein
MLERIKLELASLNTGDKVSLARLQLLQGVIRKFKQNNIQVVVFRPHSQFMQLSMNHRTQELFSRLQTNNR